MKKLIFFSLIALSISLISSSCGGKGGDPKPCSETAMIVSTDPANGSTQMAAPGPDFPLQVNITSNLPSAGVTIQVTAAPDAGGPAFFTKTQDANTNITNFTITGTPSGVVSKVNITITSKGCNTNTWTGSYRYSKK